MGNGSETSAPRGCHGLLSPMLDKDVQDTSSFWPWKTPCSPQLHPAKGTWLW